MADIGKLVLKKICNDESYARTCLPFIKPEYFEGDERIAYSLILDFITKYNALPTKSTLEIEFSDSDTNSEANQGVLPLLSDCVIDEEVDSAWMLENTEKWCKDRALFLGIMKSIEIIDGKNEGESTGAIPDILTQALGVTFDRHIGHDYMEDMSSRYDFYHTDEERFPFDLDFFNQITGGGLVKKSLNCIMAGCVHPTTKIVIRLRTEKDPDFLTTEIQIGKIQKMLQTGTEIEVTSPDGWVGISEFVDKGMWTKYILESNGKIVVCNENHLFETASGWVSAKRLAQQSHESLFLCEDREWHPGKVIKTDERVPIVDIQVEHENHRYYTEGISSHNTGVGKSLALCHLAAANLFQGLNVLYITLEMSEERIAERIDANLLDTDIQNLEALSKSEFANKIGDLQKKTQGKLVIKEYPTASAHTGHFRALLNELKLKKTFVPDIIYIDYLNICASARIKSLSGGVNSYTLVKSIAEEIRGLAVEFNLPIWTATQTNRAGFDSSDTDITDISESFGLAYTLDLFLAMIATEQLTELGQVMFKQLKNRYNDLNHLRRFVVGIDRPKMRLYDVSDSAQVGIIPEVEEISIGKRPSVDTESWRIS